MFDDVRVTPDGFQVVRQDRLIQLPSQRRVEYREFACAMMHSSTLPGFGTALLAKGHGVWSNHGVAVQSTIQTH